MVAFFRADLDWATQPFSRWLRNVGMAMAARMPMMMMTTRSSMSVKPESFFAMALLMRASMCESPSRTGAGEDPARPGSATEAAGPARWGPLAFRDRLAAGLAFLALAR